MKGPTVTLAALAGLGLPLAGCGGSTPHPGPSAAAGSAAPPLTAGSSPQRIAATIQAFYRATWRGQPAAACRLFTPQGRRGFLRAAEIQFPISVTGSSTCPEAMSFVNRALASTVSSLQGSGVTVSPHGLDRVGVSRVHVSGDTATAQAPEGVGAIIAPKLFLLVRRNGVWYIQASRKLR